MQAKRTNALIPTRFLVLKFFRCSPDLSLLRTHFHFYSSPPGVLSRGQTKLALSTIEGNSNDTSRINFSDNPICFARLPNRSVSSVGPFSAFCSKVKYKGML